MTSFTPNAHLPYPDMADTANVPRDIQALAVALDTAPARSALSAAPVLDVGMAGQLRAGRQLTVADFTALGLSTPLGLFNLGDLTNLGSGGALSNKGAVPFGVGINGQASTCAVFAGSTAQALYIADTGAADPFRIRTGSWGCWFRTAKRGTTQTVLSKWGAAGARSWWLGIGVNNLVTANLSTDGSAVFPYNGVSDICDDRWHHVVVTHDGTAPRIYIDGVLEATGAFATSIFVGAAPLNIGGEAADGATAATSPHYGRVDEAFVSADVLSDDQVRMPYCAKVAHGYSVTPSRVSLNVRRLRRGAPFVVADFPIQPLRHHNFTGGALTDQGSNNVALVSNPGSGAILSVAGVDGALGGAYSFSGAHTGMSSTDAGLPAGTSARSYGCWFKTATAVGSLVIAGWGTQNANHVNLYVGTGALTSGNGADVITGPYAADGQWHQAIVVEDNAAGDGVRRKLYLDGRLVGGSTVLNAVTLAGANRFRVGANPDGTAPYVGQIDGPFVCGYGLTFEWIAALYAKGSQALAPSPKEPGAHVESFDATNVYVTFDTLDSTAQVDLAVAA